MCIRDRARDFHIVNPYLTTIRLHEPDDVLEEHTLSRSTATDDGRQFADRNREVNSLQDRLVSKFFFDTDQPDHRCYSKADVRKWSPARMSTEDRATASVVALPSPSALCLV